MRYLTLAAAAVLLSTLAIDARATTITETYTGMGSGSLNGVAFSQASFTITAIGDVSSRTSFGLGYDIYNTSAQINIEGVGTYKFLDPTYSFVNNGYQIVGFGLGNDKYNGPTSSSFATWDMLSSIGPISGFGTLMQWGSGVRTDGGGLVFDYGTSPETFTADIDTTPVPEPSTILLLGAGVVGVGAFGRRRTAKRHLR